MREPEGMAKHRDVGPGGRLILGDREIATERRGRIEEPEEARTDDRHPHLAGFGPNPDGEVRFRERRRTGEGVRPARQVDVAGVLEAIGGLLDAAVRRREIDPVGGAGIAEQRRWPKQHPVHDGEHGHVRADAERQRQHDAEREAGAFRERSQRVAEVLG